MFMTKKKKEQLEREAALAREAEEARAIEEAKARQEADEQAKFDKKLALKKAYNSLKMTSTKLEKYKNDCIDKLVAAQASGDSALINTYKACVKLAISKQKFTSKMIGQFEFSMELNELNKIVNGFVSGISIMSEELKDVVSTVDLSKAQRAFEEAIAKNENQMEALNAFLETASDSASSFSGIEDSISDAELDEIVSARVASKSGNVDNVDADIAKMEAALGAND